MSFDNKEYPNRKDNRRKYYRGSKRFDRSCRNHGRCPYCEQGRLHKRNIARQALEDRMEDYDV